MGECGRRGGDGAGAGLGWRGRVANVWGIIRDISGAARNEGQRREEEGRGPRRVKRRHGGVAATRRCTRADSRSAALAKDEFLGTERR